MFWKKAEGKIKQAGISFHDTPELLDEILRQYGSGLDFVQLQINYADWGFLRQILDNFKSYWYTVQAALNGL